MYYAAMPSTVNLRLNDSLAEFANSRIGDQADYDTMSEYVRDLIRKDKVEKEARDFEIVKRLLREAFAQDPADAVPFNRADFFTRANARADKRLANKRTAA